jgi:hypothetical protein
MADLTRGERLLEFVEDEVANRLNPSDEECWYCGGEGETYDCIDGCCLDAESGCSDCARPCYECRMRERARLKAIREEVIKSGDVDLAAAWLKSIRRWRDDITDDQIRAELETAKAKIEQPATADAR